MLDAILNLFSRKPAPLKHYRFPLIIPSGGNAGSVEGAGVDYVSARLDAMGRVDTGAYLVGLGIEITIGGDAIN